MSQSHRSIVRSMAFACVLVVAAGAVPAAAQDSDATWEQDWIELFNSATGPTETDHRFHLETMSCGEFVAVTQSDSENDRAVAVMVTVWAHGYHNGLKGINFEARPMSLEGMVTLLRGLLEECGRHPDELFHTAVMKLD